MFVSNSFLRSGRLSMSLFAVHGRRINIPRLDHIVRRPLCHVLCLWLIGMLWGCGGGGGGGAGGAYSAGTVPLRLAHDQNFPPFAEVVDGRSQGMAIDLIEEAARRAGLTLKLVPVAQEQVQRTLEDGRADAVFPVAINAQRRETMDFGRPLLMSGGALFVRAPQTTPQNIAWLEGKVVVTPKTGPLAAFLAKNAPDATLIVTTDYEESLSRLISGEADAAALNMQVGTMLAAQRYPGRITPADRLFLELPLALATAKGKGDLLKPLDDAIEQMRADGVWQAIVDRWSEH